MSVDIILKRYGRSAGFMNKRGGLIQMMNAFISPLRYKNKMYLYGVNTEIGYNSQGHYLYIGPPDPDITQCENGEYIFCMGEKYRIDRAEKVYKGNKVFYIWAIIRVMVDAEGES